MDPMSIITAVLARSLDILKVQGQFLKARIIDANKFFL